MWNMVFIRFLRGLLTVAVTIVLIFVVLRVAPGDPASLLAGADASEEQVGEIRELWGLDKPIWEQFIIYTKSLITGDAGMSYQYSNNATPTWSVVDLVKSRFPGTIKLSVAAMLICIVVGIPLGVLSAMYHDSWFDTLIMSTSLTILSFPTFFVGLLLIAVFSVNLHWLPSGGTGTWRHIILPACTLAISFTITLIRMTRTEIMAIMSSDYIKTVRAKGLSSFTVLFVHGLRNAAIPIITLIGQRFGAMLGGTVIIETLYNWPGIGNLLITSINSRDYPTVQYLVPYVAVVFIVINVIVDILYGVLDPRIHREA